MLPAMKVNEKLKYHLPRKIFKTTSTLYGGFF
jgi:hypothetical protein